MRIRDFVAVGCVMSLIGCTTVDIPVAQESASSSSSAASVVEGSEPELVADNLQIPWAIAFLPTGDLLVTERPGTLLRIGVDRNSYPIEGVHHRGEGGLLGVVLHPDFEENSWIYLYFTTTLDGGTTNRVERYRFENDQLTERTEILTNIPGSLYHDGGGLAFGPDGYLYVTTGDAGNTESAQDTNSLAGKILRITDEGDIPEDNPFDNAVYSYGHRNVQGIAWDDDRNLWATEHGRSGVTSGFDELNRIEAGKNYGWPTIQGSQEQEGMEIPALHSGATNTWAPASAAYIAGSVYFGGLRGEALYEAVLGTGEPELRTHLFREYGRIRAVAVGPDGMLYITTSNRDGRGSVRSGDDRILRIDPASL